jgi:hypothetical protein
MPPYAAWNVERTPGEARRCPLILLSKDRGRVPFDTVSSSSIASRETDVRLVVSSSATEAVEAYRSVLSVVVVVVVVSSGPCTVDRSDPAPQLSTGGERRPKTKGRTRSRGSKERRTHKASEVDVGQILKQAPRRRSSLFERRVEWGSKILSVMAETV